MVSRLLLVLLILTGLIPVRICTCAASTFKAHTVPNAVEQSTELGGRKTPLRMPVEVEANRSPHSTLCGNANPL